MKGGKQLRRVSVGAVQNYNVRDVDIILSEYHVRPDDIVSVCMYEYHVYVYYLSES